MNISRFLSFQLFFFTFFKLNFLYAAEPLPFNNIVLHKNPLQVSQVKFKDFDSKDIVLNKNDGKIKVINFWATWCAPCKREMPSLEKLTFKYPEIKVFAINTEKPNKIRTRDFFRSVGVTTLNTYYDSELSLVKTFKLRGLPTSILIDKNGNEFGRVIGEVDFVSDDFISLIKKYI